MKYDFSDISWVYNDHHAKTASRNIWSDMIKKSIVDYWLPEEEIVNEDIEIIEL